VFDDLIEVASGGWGLGIAALVGVGLLAARGGRPLAKQAIRGYLSVTDTVRGWTADMVEQAQDLYAESKAEVSKRSNRAAAEA
jgi:Protein of unknown function (DUF5132)